MPDFEVNPLPRADEAKEPQLAALIKRVNELESISQDTAMRLGFMLPMFDKVLDAVAMSAKADSDRDLLIVHIRDAMSSFNEDVINVGHEMLNELIKSGYMAEKH